MTTDKKGLAAAMGRRRPTGVPTVPKTAATVSSRAADKTPEDVVAEANRTAGKPYPRRVALDLTEEQLRALQLAHVEDSIPITTRVRALVVLWMSRPELAAEAAKLATLDVEAARRARSKPRN